MPTAAKLAATLLFALTAYLTAVFFKPAMPEGTQWGYFLEISTGIGAICGWIVMGNTVGRGTTDAIGTGVKTSVVVAFWAVLIFAIIAMVKASYKRHYDGPMEAVLGTFSFMLDYGKLMASPEVIGTLFIGGVLGGILTEWVSARWR